ncbi:BREX-1 system adenine-specific DNA-methyltransferase PglX [Methanobacterium congolense]|uniref:site-specific DNA-methyltransferase (adenine-specific) n=1 Tax=Methanobacterium congolense TaxID=118062 RepID=A0A1D3L1J0_9EURY|nr:BREX-1 system adenine-specific DNA-methyltransferase PglX [Methanobacterium congolense]SCG85423.1 putative adenine-specific methylase MJECS02 [Methanobacterium congolense]
MDKKAIKTFAIEARKKLIEEVKYQASLLGITADGITEPVEKAEGIEVYDIGAATPNTIYDEAIKQRESLVKRINEKGFDNVVEEVAYTWFNRIIAIRFMEVNDYLPTRVRVLSSETEGKIEPDIITESPNIDLDFTEEEIEQTYQLKNDNKLDELFKLLFIKQCNKLNEILPELFEKTADYTELLLSISFTNEEGTDRQLIDNISEEDFKDQVEIIGWLYQYYNTELKDDTFKQLKKRVKISKERIPAATQLFTPDWIVRYMVENSLGRLWLEGHPDNNLKENWKYYLDEAEQEPEVQIELAKIQEESKNLKPEDIKVIDPAMGSGHILVYAFEVLMQIYTSVGYSKKDATESILKNNLYGLDIDDRAYQLAYFAVMMKARSYNKGILTKNIEPQICAIQESKGISDELIDFIADGNSNIRKDLIYLVETFKDAKEYGSILKVKEDIDYHRLEKQMDNIKKMNIKTIESINYQNKSLSIIQPLIKQLKLLLMKFDIVTTNPPYMSRNSMNKNVAKYLQSNYPDSKWDIFGVFIEKCQDMLNPSSFLSIITQHSFMFLSVYENLRKKILLNDIINMAHLGTRAFEEIGGEVVQTTSFVLRKSNLENYNSTYCRLVNFNNQDKKEKEFLLRNNLYQTKKTNYTKIPGSTIAYWIPENVFKLFEKNKISDFAEAKAGIVTGNDDFFIKAWYEISFSAISFDITNFDNEKIPQWVPINKGGTYRKFYGNNTYIINLKDLYDIEKTSKSVRRGDPNYYFKESITWSMVTANPSFRYSINNVSGVASPSLFVFNKDYTNYLLGFLNSNVSEFFTNTLNPTVNLHTGDVLNLPIIISEQHISEINRLVEENISILKEDWDSYETSYNFKSHDFLIYSRKFDLNMIEKNFLKMKLNYETQLSNYKSNLLKMNEIFIQLYEMENILDNLIPENQIELKNKNQSNECRSLISYAVGCILGRYSLDKEGLIYAGGQWDPSKYSKFIPDDDNIIPILDTEYFEDDIVGRFVEFVKVTFGEETLEENLEFIAKGLKKKGTTSREIIRNYFLTDFYKDHVKTYKKHPIYWQFDSGKNNGFKALIYMQRYEPDLVARVRIDYLHKTQKALETTIAHNERIMESSTSTSEKSKAVKTRNKLVKQLEETRKYDEALAHIANQKIEIELDDGVKVNYAKFQGVEVNKGQKTTKINLLKKI